MQARVPEDFPSANGVAGSSFFASPRRRCPVPASATVPDRKYLATDGREGGRGAPRWEPRSHPPASGSTPPKISLAESSPSVSAANSTVETGSSSRLGGRGCAAEEDQSFFFHSTTMARPGRQRQVKCALRARPGRRGKLPRRWRASWIAITGALHWGCIASICSPRLLLMPMLVWFLRL
jgi:hypothetical protein